MKKKLLVLSTLTVVGIMSATFLVSNRGASLSLKADQCNHNGYHYARKDATATASGYQEFWTCCECHQSWLSKPEGTFIDGSESTMTGGLGSDHIAYLAPVGDKPSVSTNYDFESKENRIVDIDQEYIRKYLDAETLDKQFEYARYSVSDKGANIDTKSAGGTQNLGITWESDGSGEYTIYIADNKEFNGYWSTKTSDLYLNDGITIPGNDYYYMVYGEDQTAAVSFGRFHTKEYATRFVYMPGVDKNGAYMTCGWRDLGGWPTMYGTRTSYGRIYRGAQLNGTGDQRSAYATDEALNIASKYLGIKYEIDLRNSTESGSQTTSYINGCTYGKHEITSYAHLFKNTPTTQFASIFSQLAKEENYPVYFHCVAGADRTGSLSFFINSLLGVGMEDLFRDFELKTFAQSGGTRNREDLSNWNEEVYTFTPGRYLSDTSFNALLDACNSLYPETTVWSEKMYRIMNEYFGVSATDLNNFLRINLGFVPEKFQNKAKATVNFVNCDLEPMLVYKGTSITHLPIATKVGYEFDKWLTLEGEPYEITSIVNDDITLVASYKKIANNLSDSGKRVYEWSINNLKVAQQLAKVERTFDGNTRIYTRTFDQSDYSFTFPKLDFTTNATYQFELSSHWENHKFLIEGTDITGFFTGQLGNIKTVTITKGGNVLVDGVYKMTLPYDVRHGNRGIEATIRVQKDSSAASFIISDIYSTTVNYLDNMEDLLAKLSNADLSNVTNTDVENYLAYNSNLNYLTDYERNNYVTPQAITDFENAISDKVATVTYIDNLTGSTVTEKVVKNTVHSDYFTFENKDYTFAYYTIDGVQYDFSSPITGDITVTSNYYTYSYDNSGTPEVILDITDSSVGTAVINASGGTVVAAWPNSSQGYNEFSSRVSGTRDSYCHIPAINYNKYHYVDFKISPRNVKQSLYVGDTQLFSNSVSSEFAIAIKDGELYVNGSAKCSLPARVLNGLESLVLRFEKPTSDAGVESYRIFNFYAYKTTTNDRNYVVSFEKNGVNLGYINVINGNKAYDASLCDSPLEGVSVSGFTYNGEEFDFTNPITSDITLEPVYEYTSAVTGQVSHSSDVHELKFDSYNNYRGLYGVGEHTINPGNSYKLNSYTFAYWTSDTTNLTPFTFGNELLEDTTLYAVWTINETGEKIVLPNGGHGAETKLTVTFRGTSVVQEVGYGTCATEIDPPSSIAISFAYWSLNGKEFDFSTQITESITLIATYFVPADDISDYPILLVDSSTAQNLYTAVNNVKDFEYITKNSGNGIEFGLRLAGITDYTIKMMKFNFSEYSVVSFKIKNGWTNATFKCEGVTIKKDMAPNTYAEMKIIGSSLYCDNVLVTNSLSANILNGTDSLTFEATVPTDHSSSGLSFYSIYTYKLLSYYGG